MPKVPVPAAAIDLGSNSFRLMIGFRTGQELSALARTRTPIRLAHGLGQTGLLSVAKRETALAALSSFRREMDRFAVSIVRCCGSEALRRATNRLALIEPAEKILGSPVEILSGQEEAELSHLGVRSTLSDNLSYPCLIADVGGGSSELIFQESPAAPAKVISLPIGAVVLAELSTASRGLVLRNFSDQIKIFLGKTGRDTLKTFVGTGGTASSLAMLAQQLPVYNAGRINGFFLSESTISVIYRFLAMMPIQQRQEVPGLEAGREDIIISGLEIYQEIIATIGATGMMVSDAGLLEGILFSITGCLNLP
ncbi:MAG: hypothetical protein HGA96_02810 [Desulfobulbaceae bacterium]|nr:hypothetical protein [Desulfobulbaceae bacterium]